MKLKREVAKRLTPYMKAKGFMLSKGDYYYIANDVAYCISLDTPSGIIYVTAYIIPLYVPCEGRYYTYGKRVQDYSLPQLSKDSSTAEIDKWCLALCQYFEDYVFPFFERINSPDRIAKYVEKSRFTGIYEFSCPPIHLERLKLFTYLYLNDLTNVSKAIDSYRKLLRKNEFLADSVKKKLLDEIDAVESAMQHDHLGILNLCTQIMYDTKKYFF